jgi:disulfide bond formation protein DsbB
MLTLQTRMDKSKQSATLLYLVWIQALVAMLGSLFFSEVMHFPPCVLCWYQRIAMYPLVLILPIGILAKDKHIARYVLPLALIGLGIAVYHSLLYYQLIPKSLAPCIQGISCTTKYIEWFGFITIPLLSTLGFLNIIIGLIWAGKLNKSTTEK